MKVLLVDNFDSFTYNLQHLIQVIEAVEVTVVTNDQPLVDIVTAENINAVVIGPGPGAPDEAEYFGDNYKLIEHCAANKLPLLGVCLGHQGINNYFGGKLKILDEVYHGKTSDIKLAEHCPLFKGLPSQINIMRYHSLIIDEASLSDDLQIVAKVSDESNTCMAIAHKTLPIWGVQFHPESFISQGGLTMMQNFVSFESIKI